MDLGLMKEEKDQITRTVLKRNGIVVNNFQSAFI